jgi:hypothetical protein
MQIIQDFAQKGAIILINEENFRESLERECFLGNPLWIVSTLDTSTIEVITPISEEHFIPLFSSTIDADSLSGYTVKQIDITNLSTTESIREVLRKYLELESGGLFKNLE